jgi:hypothetical protein
MKKIENEALKEFKINEADVMMILLDMNKSD